MVCKSTLPASSHFNEFLPQLSVLTPITQTSNLCSSFSHFCLSSIHPLSLRLPQYSSPQTRQQHPHTSTLNQTNTNPPGQKKERRKNMHFFRTLLTAIALIILPLPAHAGPAAYGICQAGCAAVVTACYGAAGAIWGATAGIGAAPAVLACNASFGTCSAACAAIALAPTP